MTDSTSPLDGAPPSEATTRLRGLEQAIHAARGRVDHEILDAADDLVRRGGERLQRSSEHTIVALAGATGSGKSSLFNALADLEIAGVGVRRPTTSWTLACAWGPAGGDEILEWIGVPPRHRVSRMSMLDRSTDDTKLEGLILLDLPDHDSTEVAHHLEMERLVKYADLVVWVLDPQKYADAAIHERYIRPMATHADTTLVVLNQIDRIAYDMRDMALDDVRRLVDEGGLTQTSVLAVSATRGDGVDELKRELARRIRAKESARTRLTSEITTRAGEVAQASGTTKTDGVTDAAAENVTSRLGEAAGVGSVVEAVGSTVRRGIRKRTDWPPTRWVRLRKPDPVMRLASQTEVDATQLVAAAAPSAGIVQRSAVDQAIRSFADDASGDLKTPWSLAIRDVTTARSAAIGDGLDAAVSETPLRVRVPVWASIVNVVQYLLLVAFVAGIVWWWVGSVLETDGIPAPGVIFGVDQGLVLALGALVAGLLLALIGLVASRMAERSKAAEARDLLNESVATVARNEVIAPVKDELERYNACRDGLHAALR